MKLSNRTFIILVICILAAVIILINLPAIKAALKAKNVKAKVNGNAGASGAVIGSASSGGGYTGATATGLNKDLVLQQGVTGPEVKELQHLINVATDNDFLLQEDGIFGSDTDNALYSISGLDSITLAQAWTLYVSYLAPSTPAASTTATTTPATTTTSPSFWDYIFA